MRIFLFARPDSQSAAEGTSALIDLLEGRGIEWMINKNFAESASLKSFRKVGEEHCYDNFDSASHDTIVVTYGGDGTLLEAVNALKGRPLAVLGINSGRLGFLANVPKSDIPSAIDELLAGRYTTEQRSMLQVDGDFDEPIDFSCAFNEFSIQRHNVSMIEIVVEIDGKHTATYWSDGAIVATPTGSTAYSLSAGGPIVVPTCNCFVVTPIAPHNLTMRPIVVPDSSTVRLSLRSRDKYAFAGLDNHNYRVRDRSSFTVRKSDKSVFLIKLQNISFYDTLKDKMMWGIDRRETKSL